MAVCSGPIADLVVGEVDRRARRVAARPVDGGPQHGDRVVRQIDAFDPERFVIDPDGHSVSVLAKTAASATGMSVAVALTAAVSVVTAAAASRRRDSRVGMAWSGWVRHSYRAGPESG